MNGNTPQLIPVMPDNPGLPPPVCRNFCFQVQVIGENPSAECVNLLAQAMDCYTARLSTREREAVATWFNAIYGGAA